MQRSGGSISRRGLLAVAAAAPAAAQAGAALAQAGVAAPDDAAYWAKVAALYDAPPAGVIQLENGHFGAMAKATRVAFEAHTLKVNRETTLYTRGPVNRDLGAVRQRAARLLGVDPGEIAFTRGGTESMQVLIEGYNRLKAGDGVLYADLDYDSMQSAMQSLARQRGVKVAKIDLPEPSTKQSLIDAYDKGLSADKAIRLVLVTHLSHRTGLVPPVKEIIALAKSHNADVLLDCGHALGQMDFSLREMGVEFAGLNLHKWIGAPLGVGLVYIAKPRLADIDPSPLEDAFLKPATPDRIDLRVHTGTTNYGAVLSIPDAIAVHESIGITNKAARLRWLRDRWVRQVRGVGGIEVLTPDDAALHAGMTSFRFTGKTTMADNEALRRRLFDQYKVFTIERAGPAKGACVRVTPSMINTAEDMDALAAALKAMVRA